MRAALEQRFGTTDRAAHRRDRLRRARGARLARRRCCTRASGGNTGLAASGSTAPSDVAVVEIPLLYETGADGAFDVVVVVTASDEVRDGAAVRWSTERSGRLIPDDEKVRRADFAYVNDGSLDELEDVRRRGRRRAAAVRRGKFVLVAAVVVVAAGLASRSASTPSNGRLSSTASSTRSTTATLVREHAARNDLDAALVAAVIYEESRFRPRARSRAGAIGLMQLQPMTGRDDRPPDGRQRIPGRRSLRS